MVSFLIGENIMSKKFDINAGMKLDGEKEFKKAISGINSDMRVLGSELVKMSSKYSGNANSIKALTDKDKVLSDQIEKQKQKVSVLNDALEKSKKEYGENDTRVDNWKVQLNKAETQLNSMNSELEQNQKAMKEAKGSIKGTASSIDEFGKKTKESKKKTLDFKAALKANLTSDAIVGGVKSLTSKIRDLGEALVNCSTDAAAYADDVLTLSAQTGISTKKIQEYKYMTELVDVPVETLTKSMAKNIKSMKSAADGTKTASDAYKTLGIKVTDSHGKLRDGEKVYWDCVDALGKIKNETQRDSIAMQLFGKSAQQLNPMIKKGSGGMKDLAKEANSMGAVMSGKALNALGEADDATQRMNQSMDILKRQIGAKLAPKVEELTKKFTTFCTENGDEIAEFVDNGIEKLGDGLVWIKDNWKEVSAVAGTFIGLLVVAKVTNFVNTFVCGFRTIKTAIDAAKVSQVVLNAVQAASPVGVMLALAGAVAGIAIAYGLTSKNANKIDYSKLTDKQEKERASINSNAKAYVNLDKTRRKNFKSIDLESAKTEELRKKLGKIVDKNGKVKKGYENRAKYITGELSKATGVEIDLVNGTIKKYTKLDNKLKDVANQMRANAALSADEDLYNEAKTKQTETYKTMKSAKNDIEDITKQIEKQEKEAKIATQMAQKAKMVYADPNRRSMAEAEASNKLDDAEVKLEQLKIKLESLRGTYNKASTTLQRYNITISNHDKLQEAVASGSTKKMKNAMLEMVNNMETAETGTASSLLEQKNVFKKTYDDIKEDLKNKVPGVTKEMVREAKNVYELSSKELDKMKGKYKKSGSENAKEYGKGAKSQKGTIKKDFIEIGQAGKNGFKSVDYQEVGVGVAKKLRAGMTTSEESKKIINSMKSLGMSSAEGFLLGLNDLKGKAIPIFNSVYKDSKNALDSHSPSKKYIKLGEDSGKGYEIGSVKSIKKAAKATINELNKLAKTKTSIESLQVNPAQTNTYKAAAVYNDSSTDIGSGDLNLNIKLDGKVLYESNYKEFRKRKKSDPRVSWG